MTWVRGVAIRPVPSYAVVDKAALEKVQDDLGADGARTELDAAFVRFERTQPFLAERVTAVLGRPLDETALALGYFLSIAIWIAFERTFPERLAEVSADALQATEDALTLEEELRASHADEPIDLDDIVAREQPGILQFVHAHVEAALEGAEHTAGFPSAREASHEVDVDDVHVVYRAMLVLTLALSHAVAPARGDEPSTEEMLA